MKPQMARVIRSNAFGTIVIGALISGAFVPKSSAQSARANNTAQKAETIFYSARYYSRPGSGVNSRAHLYSIDARGGKSRQLTFGHLKETRARISPDGRTLAFEREYPDYSVEVCALELASKRVRVVLPASKNVYVAAMEWSPKGKTLAVQRTMNAGNGGTSLYLIDFPATRSRRLPNIRDWAWRPQTSQIRLSDSKGTRLLDVVSRRETPIAPALENTIWLNRDAAAKITTKSDGKPDGDAFAILKSVDILSLSGQKLRSVAPQKVTGIRKSGNQNDGMDGEEVEFDGRALLLPIAGQSTDLLLLANERTSSGAEFAFTRFDARNGQTRFLARGTRLGWTRDSKRFAVVDYHDTLPYDTLPNGHKRSVYTARLLVGDGKSALRPLVSGLVLVGDCDWSR